MDKKTDTLFWVEFLPDPVLNVPRPSSVFTPTYLQTEDLVQETVEVFSKKKWVQYNHWI